MPRGLEGCVRFEGHPGPPCVRTWGTIGALVHARLVSQALPDPSVTPRRASSCWKGQQAPARALQAGAPTCCDPLHASHARGLISLHGCSSTQHLQPGASPSSPPTPHLDDLDPNLLVEVLQLALDGVQGLAGMQQGSATTWCVTSCGGVLVWAWGR